MIAFLLALAAVLLIGLSALPKVLIQRRDRVTAVQAVADFRDTLPAAAPLDPLAAEQAEMNERWAAYWAASDRESLVLATRLRDWADEREAVAERFAATCEEIVKTFTIVAVAHRQQRACELGGWASEIERQAAIIYARTHGDIHALAHEIAVERAECTDTSWTEDDARMLAEYLDGQEVKA